MSGQHYGRVDDLTATILAAVPPDADLSPSDLAPVDEFHLGGPKATAALVADLGLTADMRVLDIGSGLGGPARHMARLVGCQVLGVDLTPGFVATANDLSRITGLDDRTSFVVGDATALGSHGRFEAATLLHVGMHVPDKTALFSAVAGMLEPGGRFGIYDIMATGDLASLAFPQPFATDRDAAWLAGPDDYGTALRAAGFTSGDPIDRSELALAALAAAPTGPLSLATAMGPEFPSMARNAVAAVRAGILAPVQIIATRAAG